MKRIGIILIVIILILTLCSCKEEEEKYEGYDIKTTQENGGIIVETENSKWSSSLDNEKERNLSFAVDAWKKIFSFEIKEDSKVSRTAQEKAGKIIIQQQIAVLAGRMKTGKADLEGVKVSTEDQKEAIRLLYDAFCVIADKEGDNNGEASEEEQKNLAVKYIDSYRIFQEVIQIYK